jgi:hypothetical protein
MIIQLVKIALLKKEAAKHYTAYNSIADKYDCGLKLTDYINPKLYKHKEKYNKIMTILENLDPACPKGIRL